MSEGSARRKSDLAEIFSKFEKRLEKKLNLLEFLDQRQKFELSKIKTSLEVYSDMFPFVDIYADNIIDETGEMTTDLESLIAQHPIQTNSILNQPKRLHGQQSLVTPFKLLPQIDGAKYAGKNRNSYQKQSGKPRDTNRLSYENSTDRNLGIRVFTSSGYGVESTEMSTGRQSTGGTSRSIAKDRLTGRLKTQASQGDSDTDSKFPKAKSGTVEHAKIRATIPRERSLRQKYPNETEKPYKTHPNKGRLSPVTEKISFIPNGLVGEYGSEQYFKSQGSRKKDVKGEQQYESLQSEFPENKLKKSKSSVALRVTNLQSTEGTEGRGRCHHERIATEGRLETSPSQDTIKCNHIHCLRCLSDYSSCSQSPERKTFPENLRFDFSSSRPDVESPSQKLKTSKSVSKLKGSSAEPVRKTPTKKKKEGGSDAEKELTPAKSKKSSSGKKKKEENLEISSKLENWSLKKEDNTPSPSFGAGKKATISPNETLGADESQKRRKSKKLQSKQEVVEEMNSTARKKLKKKAKSPDKRRKSQTNRAKDAQLQQESSARGLQKNDPEGEKNMKSTGELAYRPSGHQQNEIEPLPNMQNLLAELIGDSFEKYQEPLLHTSPVSNQGANEDTFSQNGGGLAQSLNRDDEARQPRNQSKSGRKKRETEAKKKQKGSSTLLEAPKGSTKKAFLFGQKPQSSENLNEENPARNNMIESVRSLDRKENGADNDGVVENSKQPANQSQEENANQQVQSPKQQTALEPSGNDQAQKASDSPSKPNSIQKKDMVTNIKKKQPINLSSQKPQNSSPDSTGAVINHNKSDSKASRSSSKKAKEAVSSKNSKLKVGSGSNSISEKTISKRSSMATEKQHEILLEGLAPEQLNKQFEDFPDSGMESFSSQKLNEMIQEEIANLNSEIKMDESQEKKPHILDLQGSENNHFPATDTASELGEPKGKKLQVKKKFFVIKKKEENKNEPASIEPAKSKQEDSKEPQNLIKSTSPIITVTPADNANEGEIKSVKELQDDIPEGKNIPSQEDSNQLSKERLEDNNSSSRSNEYLKELTQENVSKQKKHPQVPTLRTDKIKRPESELPQPISNQANFQNLPTSEEFSLGLISNRVVIAGHVEEEKKGAEGLELPEFSEIHNAGSDEGSNSWYEKLSQELQRNPFSNITSETQTQYVSNPKRLFTSEIMKEIEKGIEIEVPAEKGSIYEKLVVGGNMTDRSGPIIKSDILKEVSSNQNYSDRNQTSFENKIEEDVKSNAKENLHDQYNEQKEQKDHEAHQQRQDHHEYQENQALQEQREHQDHKDQLDHQAHNEHQDYQEHKEHQEQKEQSEYQDNQDNEENKGYREQHKTLQEHPAQKEHQDNQNQQGHKELEDHQAHQDHQYHQAHKEHQAQKEYHNNQEHQDQQDHQGHQEQKVYHDNQDYQEYKELQEPKDYNDDQGHLHNQNHQAYQEQKEHQDDQKYYENQEENTSRELISNIKDSESLERHEIHPQEMITEVQFKVEKDEEDPHRFKDEINVLHQNLSSLNDEPNQKVIEDRGNAEERRDAIFSDIENERMHETKDLVKIGKQQREHENREIGGIKSQLELGNQQSNKEIRGKSEIVPIREVIKEMMQAEFINQSEELKHLKEELTNQKEELRHVQEKLKNLKEESEKFSDHPKDENQNNDQKSSQKSNVIVDRPIMEEKHEEIIDVEQRKNERTGKLNLIKGQYDAIKGNTTNNDVQRSFNAKRSDVKNEFVCYEEEQKSNVKAKKSQAAEELNEGHGHGSEDSGHEFSDEDCNREESIEEDRDEEELHDDLTEKSVEKNQYSEQIFEDERDLSNDVHDFKEVNPEHHHLPEEHPHIDDFNRVRGASLQTKITLSTDRQKNLTNPGKPSFTAISQQNSKSSQIEGKVPAQDHSAGFKPITLDCATQTDFPISSDFSMNFPNQSPHKHSTAINTSLSNDEIPYDFYHRTEDSRRSSTDFVEQKISRSNYSTSHFNEPEEVPKEEHKEHLLFDNLLREKKSSGPVIIQKQTSVPTIPSLQLSAEYTPKSTTSRDHGTEELPPSNHFHQQDNVSHLRSSSHSIFSDINSARITVQHPGGPKEKMPVTGPSSNDGSVNLSQISNSGKAFPVDSKGADQYMGGRRDPSLMTLGNLDYKSAKNEEVGNSGEVIAATSLERTLIFAREFFGKRRTVTPEPHRQRPAADSRLDQKNSVTYYLRFSNSNNGSGNQGLRQ